MKVILFLHLVYLKYIVRACLCTKCAFCLCRSSGTVNTVWTMRGYRSRTPGWAPAASSPSSLPRASACPSIRCPPVSAPAPSISARSRPPTAIYPPTAYPTRTGSVSLTLSISLVFYILFWHFQGEKRRGERKFSWWPALREAARPRPCLYANSAVFLLPSTTCAKSSLSRATWALSPGLLRCITTSNSNNSWQPAGVSRFSALPNWETFT